MKIVLRVHENAKEEIQLGHKLSFTSENNITALSATANLNGLTPLAAILRYFRISKKGIINQVVSSNVNGHVKFIDTFPKLILIPPTRGVSGRNQAIEYYLVEALKVCNMHNINDLHFTHFGFMNDEFKEEEICRILKILLNPLIFTTLEKLYWEIDARYLDQMLAIYYYIDHTCFGNSRISPSIIYAPKINYSDYINFIDLSYRDQFLRDQFLKKSNSIR